VDSGDTHTPMHRQSPGTSISAPPGGRRTSRKDQESWRHFSPSCHEASAEGAGPRSLDLERHVNQKSKEGQMEEKWIVPGESSITLGLKPSSQSSLQKDYGCLC
jgi:hypothetical protein